AAGLFGCTLSFFTRVLGLAHRLFNFARDLSLNRLWRRPISFLVLRAREQIGYGADGAAIACVADVNQTVDVIEADARARLTDLTVEVCADVAPAMHG